MGYPDDVKKEKELLEAFLRNKFMNRWKRASLRRNELASKHNKAIAQEVTIFPKHLNALIIAFAVYETVKCPGNQSRRQAPHCNFKAETHNDIFVLHEEDKLR